MPMRQLKITQSITNRDSITLEKYFNDVSREVLLTAEEEVNLAQRIREGDEAAKERLVKANLRFVISVAKQYQSSKLTLNDLINEGNIGLIKAAQRFDEKRGFKFISYAVWWIRQSILQAIVEKSRMIRLPANKMATLSKIDQVSSSYMQQYEREPTEEELSDIMEMSVGEIKKAISSASQPSSVDKPFAEGEASSLLDVLENQESNLAEDEVVHNDSLKRDVTRLLEVLSEKEATIVKMYFGIADSSAHSLEAISDYLGISKERVRQIKERALKKLAAHPSNKLLVPYLG